MNKIEFLNSDSESSNNNSVSSVVEKKIFPVYNENNFYISKEIIHMILRSVNIVHTVNNIEIWQKAFIHKSYCDNTDFRKNEKFLYTYENVKFYKNDCSHRYLTKILSGLTYHIIDDILYLSLDFNKQNLTQQQIPFNINYYREKMYN